MSGTKRLVAAVTSLLAALLLVSGCGSSASKAPSQKQWSGAWTVTVSFGTATLTVNKDGTLLTDIKYTVSCGAADQKSGSVGATAGNPGWSIDTAGNFDFKDTPFVVDVLGSGDANTLASMSGQFAKGGKSAAGQWSLAVNDGTHCNANWTSSR